MSPWRYLPPSAASLHWPDIAGGLAGMFSSEEALSGIREELKNYFGIAHVYLVSSGMAALYIALLALRQEAVLERDEVVIPAYTCYSVPSAIAKAGLKIRLCDIDSDTLDFDYRMLEITINNRSLCVIPTHLFGKTSDMYRVREIARSSGAAVVEDAAQSMGGSSWRGVLAGTQGDISLFSLGRGKCITAGSGGILLTNSGDIGSRIERILSDWTVPGLPMSLYMFFSTCLLSVFVRPGLFEVPAHLPFLGVGETVYHHDFPARRMGGIQAGVMKNWIARMERANESRRRVASSLRERLQGLEGLFIPRDDEGAVWLRLPLIAREETARSRILHGRAGRKLGLSPMYPNAVGDIAEIRDRLRNQVCPKAVSIAKRLFTVPTHEYITPRDIDNIVAHIEMRLGMSRKAVESQA